MSARSRSLLPVPEAALVRRRSLVGFRTACEDFWGSDGVLALTEALPADVRERTAGLLPLPEWLPLDDLIAWHVAAWNGPAGRDKAIMTQHARRTVDQGFGRVKRFVLSIATPHALAPRVAALWGDEYSTGSLTAAISNADSVTLTLRGHAYVEHPLMRWIIAEAFRHIVGMTNVKDVTEVHTAHSGSLTVVLRWR